VQDDGLDLMENALERHFDELPVAVAARVRMLTLLRRLAVLAGFAALGVAMILTVAWGRPLLFFWLAPAFVVGSWLWKVNRRVRIAIARMGLGAVEAGRKAIASVGGAGSSTAASALVAPPLTVRAPTETRATAPPPRREPPPDRDAPDFDDA
jgi:hypothetical protein